MHDDVTGVTALMFSNISDVPQTDNKTHSAPHNTSTGDVEQQRHDDNNEASLWWMNDKTALLDVPPSIGTEDDAQTLSQRIPAIEDVMTMAESVIFVNANSYSAFPGEYDDMTTVSDEGIPMAMSSVELIVVISLSVLIVGIVIGNALVLVSVACFTRMRTLSNGLIASLASADLLVSVAVLPISLRHELSPGGRWTLGPYLCDLWITSDVFCCTASILNIVVIALDRYWLITKNVSYSHNDVLPRRRICVIMLIAAWTVSAIIACLPLFGWRAGTEKKDPEQCLISQDYGFTVFSTFGAFWFPLLIILVVYFKIFFFARQRAMRRTPISRPTATATEKTITFCTPVPTVTAESASICPAGSISVLSYRSTHRSPSLTRSSSLIPPETTQPRTADQSQMGENLGPPPSCNLNSSSKTSNLEEPLPDRQHSQSSTRLNSLFPVPMNSLLPIPVQFLLPPKPNFHRATPTPTRRHSHARSSDSGGDEVSPPESSAAVPSRCSAYDRGGVRSSTDGELSEGVASVGAGVTVTVAVHIDDYRSRTRKNRSARMRRSARMLGLIIGGFLVCWMPFFVVATIAPFCETCVVPKVVSSFVTWLGYFNSLLNPAIYAIWDKSFRRSFRRICTCDISGAASR